MSFLKDLPDRALRRLVKVIVRSIHLVGIAGVFGGAMTQSHVSPYLGLAIVSGLALVAMEANSSAIWFVQLRGIALYLKLLLLLLLHLYPQTLIPCLIAVVVISGFMSHAPSWIRYFSVWHGRVIFHRDDQLG